MRFRPGCGATASHSIERDSIHGRGVGTATPKDTTATTRLALWLRILRITRFAAARLMSGLASAATLDEEKPDVFAKRAPRPFPGIDKGRPAW